MENHPILPPGFELLEVLQPHHETPVVRAEDLRNNQSVVMKLCADGAGGASARLRRAWAICCELQSPRLIKHLALLQFGQSLALITEDFDAISLDDWMVLKHHSLEARMKVSVDLVEAVADIHREGIIHLDLKPSNVVINPKTGRLKVIDFGTATKEADKSSGTIRGSLAYMSPEHTGRTGRQVDHRSDLYSIGATLYELFTGQLPFKANDAMGMVHSHIAKQPTPPHRVNDLTPIGLSEIIIKLMAKAPEERYQSAEGLLRDLRSAWSSFRRTGTVSSFTLGQEDVSDCLTFPERQYGREVEVIALFEHYQRVRSGQKRWVLLNGYPGSGKTSLLRDIQRPISETNGHFCYGKFDPLEQQRPYHGIISALQDLLAHLLTRNRQELGPLISQLKADLGAGNEILAKLIPELRLLVGDAALRETPKSSDHTRQLLPLLRRLLGVMASQKHPLVMCLDNLQWADEASLALIEAVLLQPGSEHLLLLSACRPQAIEADHPLNQTLAHLEAEFCPVHHLELQGLELDAMAQFLADTLKRQVQDVIPLAKVLNAKTGGNPYFTRELLLSLTNRQLLTWRHGHWQWNLGHLQQLNVTENVAELVTERVQLLPAATRLLIETAACLGPSFQLPVLTATTGLSPYQEDEALKFAEQSGIIQPDGQRNRTQPKKHRSTGANKWPHWYRFTHERIQQTTYERLPPEVRRERHLAIGRHLLGQLQAQKGLFTTADVLSHLNLARAILGATEERLELAKLNLLGAQEAYATGAYQNSLNLLLIGLTSLPQSPWTKDYDLTLALHTQAARSYLMLGDLDSTIKYVEEVWQHAQNALDRIEVDLALLQAQVARGHYAEALQNAKQALARLGSSPPASKPWNRLWSEKVALNWRLRPYSTPEQLTRLPAMDDPMAMAAMEILRGALPAAQRVAPDEAPLWTYKMVELTITHGNGPWSPLAWSLYASLLITRDGQTKAALKYSELATSLLEGNENSPSTGPVYAIQATTTDLWLHTTESCIQKLIDGWTHCLQSGELDYATYCLNSSVSLAVLSGSALGSLLQRYERHLQELSDLHIPGNSHAIACWLQVIHNLTDMDHVGFQLKGSYYDITTGLAADESISAEPIPEKTRLSNHAHLAQTFLALIFGEFEVAHRHLTALNQVMTALAPPYYQAYIHFASALSALLLAHQKEGAERLLLLKSAQTHQLRVHHWTQQIPSLNQHRYHLIEAERLRAYGQWNQALLQYQKASELARERGLLHEEALICELQSKACKAVGLTDMSGYTLNRARALYRQWGAQAKVTALGQSGRRKNTTSNRTQNKATTEKKANLKRTRREDTAALDLHSVIKTARTLSREIELGRLLGQVMRIVIENAGAESGVLLLNHDGELQVEAAGEAGAESFEIQEHNPAEKANRAPLSIISYTQHTLQNVVLADAMGDERFAQDPYLQKYKPRSVLSIPFLNQGTLTGVLYLEHRSSTGIFTPNRLEVLEMLSSQLAVSIENARMFEVQRNMAQSFSRFVPVQFLQALGKHRIEDVQLGDCVERKITVLFTDLRGFTTRSEHLNARENFNLLNGYFKRMEPSIQRYGGFVDKYIGDAIMALFPGSANDGLMAGLSMFEALKAYNEELAAQGLPGLRMGIGLHTGPLMLGTVGSYRRMETTVIGDTVNLAARLEGMTKAYNTAFVLSEATHAALQSYDDYAVRRLDRVVAKGKTHPVTIFEVLSDKISQDCDQKRITLAAFNDAVDLYLSRDFGNAALLFEACLDEVPDDQVARRYLERCKYFDKRPPPEDWDGSYTIKTKSSKVA